jgi:hypothetical protein
MPEIESCVCAWLKVPLQLFNPTDIAGRQITLTQSQESPDPTLILIMPATSAHTDSIQPNQTHTAYLLTLRPQSHQSEQLPVVVLAVTYVLCFFFCGHSLVLVTSVSIRKFANTQAYKAHFTAFSRVQKRAFI